MGGVKRRWWLGAKREYFADNSEKTGIQNGKIVERR
jgi:hypothetical protein